MNKYQLLMASKKADASKKNRVILSPEKIAALSEKKEMKAAARAAYVARKKGISLTIILGDAGRYKSARAFEKSRTLARKKHLMTED